MRLISSSPFFDKYILGPIFFILGVTFSMIPWLAPHMTRGIGGQPAPFIVELLSSIGACTAGIYGLISGWSLADEVWDAGNELIVRKFRHRERIPLANIIDLTHDESGKYPKSILTLRTPCRFGRKIRFRSILPSAFTWREAFRHKPDPAIYNPLIVRINDARRQALRSGTFAH